MTSSPKKIIRGADVDGILFCTPQGAEGYDPVQKREKENLQALEDFWQKKGFDSGKQEGFDEGFATGEAEGRRKGLQEGESSGREAGYAEGYEKGLADGEEKMRETVATSIEQVEAITSQLKQRQETLYEESKAELITFSLQVCEKVMRQQLCSVEALRKIVEYVVQQAQAIIKACPVEIYLHPDAIERLSEAGAKESVVSGVMNGEATAVRFLPDETMHDGDCRLETSLGLVNFDLKRLLNEVERKVLEVRTDDQEVPEEAVPAVPERAADEAQRACASGETAGV